MTGRSDVLRTTQLLVQTASGFVGSRAQLALEQRRSAIELPQRLAAVSRARQHRHELPVRVLIQLLGPHEPPVDLSGILVRTAFGNRADRLLERIPGYTLMRNLGKRFSGDADGVSFATALVEIEDALVPAFIVEEHAADGSFTVFVPSVPTPAAGAVYVLPKERVHRVDVPMSTAVRCITQWGAGTGELLAAMHKSSDDLRLARPAAH